MPLLGADAPGTATPADTNRSAAVVSAVLTLAAFAANIGSALPTRVEASTISASVAAVAAGKKTGIPSVSIGDIEASAVMASAARGLNVFFSTSVGFAGVKNPQHSPQGTLGIVNIMPPMTLLTSNPSSEMDATFWAAPFDGNPFMVQGIISGAAGFKTGAIKNPTPIGSLTSVSQITPHTTKSSKSSALQGVQVAEQSSDAKAGNPVTAISIKVATSWNAAKTASRSGTIAVSSSFSVLPFKGSINFTTLSTTINLTASPFEMHAGAATLSETSSYASAYAVSKAPSAFLRDQVSILGTRTVTKVTSAVVVNKADSLSGALATARSEVVVTSEVNSVVSVFSKSITQTLAMYASIHGSETKTAADAALVGARLNTSSAELKTATNSTSISSLIKVLSLTAKTSVEASAMGAKASGVASNAHTALGSASLQEIGFFFEPGNIFTQGHMDLRQTFSGITITTRAVSLNLNTKAGEASSALRLASETASLSSIEALSSSGKKAITPILVLNTLEGYGTHVSVTKVAVTSMSAAFKLVGTGFKLSNTSTAMVTKEGISLSVAKVSAEASQLGAQTLLTSSAHRQLTAQGNLQSVEALTNHGTKTSLESTSIASSLAVSALSALNTFPKTTLTSLSGESASFIIPDVRSAQVGTVLTGIQAYAFINTNLTQGNISWAIGAKDWLVTLSGTITTWLGYNGGTMAKANDLTAVSSTDTRTIGWDFVNELQPGTWIVGVLKTTCAIYQGTDLLAATRLIGDAQITNSPQPPKGSGKFMSVVLQQFSEGVAGCIYTLSCQVITNNQEEITIWARLPVVRAS